MTNAEYWSKWGEKCRHELTANVMPFWMEHGLDRKNGGVYTCVHLFFQNLTPDERTILAEGCLMNFYASQNK